MPGGTARFHGVWGKTKVWDLSEMRMAHSRYPGANCSHFSSSPAALPTLQLILGTFNELQLNTSLIYLHSFLPQE